MNKSRDLYQEFDKLKLKIEEFTNEHTVDGLERVEIESLIQQVGRLIAKLDKDTKG